jgi:chromosome segregation ATPase
MGHLSTATAGQADALVNSYDLERQLQTAERRYAEARAAADKAREDWRALSIHPSTRPDQVQAARAKFEAVAARCNRLRNIIDDLEERLES